MIPAKVCPRCGTQYETLKSTTCPQCFARLVVVDEATAEELKAAREGVERTPEFQAAKAEDDEKFREQSFGACLAVLGLTLLTVIAAILLIAAAVHRQHRHPAPVTARAPAMARPGSPAGSLDILTQLPVAAASLDDVLPPTVGPYRRARRDQAITLSGTLTPLFHAVYTDGTAALQIYAVPASLPTPQQNQFRQGVALAAQIASAPTQTFATEHWRYATVGPTGGAPPLLDGFRRALGAHFQEPSP